MVVPIFKKQPARTAVSVGIAERIDELSGLKDGWLDGRGVAMPASGLRWLAGWFEDCYSADLPVPFLYPTAEGGVRAEWTLGAHEVSLDFELNHGVAYWHDLNLQTDEETAQTLDMLEDDHWQWILPVLARYAAEQA